jgi:hypothetical protein
MCDPATLAIVTGVVASAGTIYGGMAANAQGKYQQDVAEQNAAIERENVKMEQERGSREAMLLYRRVAQLRGQQRVTAAANGVSTDFGTAADLDADTSMMAREDVANIYGQTNQNVTGMDRNISNFVGEGRAARTRGKAALVGSVFEAGATMLGAGSQYKTLKAQGYGPTPRAPKPRSA